MATESDIVSFVQQVDLDAWSYEDEALLPKEAYITVRLPGSAGNVRVLASGHVMVGDVSLVADPTNLRSTAAVFAAVRNRIKVQVLHEAGVAMDKYLAAQAKAKRGKK